MGPFTCAVSTTGQRVACCLSIAPHANLWSKDEWIAQDALHLAANLLNRLDGALLSQLLTKREAEA